jgi:hypothetical protein
MITQNYRFEKLTKENIKDLVPIYKNAFKKDVSLDFLYKKQNTSFAGPSYLGYIAYAPDGEVAAFYGVFACYAIYENQRYLVAQSGDTMTLSAHTRKGLFTTLAKMTHQYCHKAGVHLIFAFPNENSYPGFVKNLNWIHFDDVQSYATRVKGISWIRLKKTFFLPSFLHHKWCKRILSKLTKGSPFSNSLQQSDVPVIEHSPDFFSYKSYSNNYLVKIKERNMWLTYSEMFLYVGDLEKCNEKEFLDIIKSLKNQCIIMGIPHIRFQTSSSTWLTEILGKYFQKMDVTHPIVGLNLSKKLPLEKMKFTMADNDTF